MSLLIFTQMVPAIVLAIPVLLIFQKIGLKDTVAGLVLINVAWWLPLIVWLLRNVFEDVPRSIEAAARIDGCSRLGTLFRITVPAAAPGISAAAILLLIGVWNEFLFAVVLGDRNAVTVTRRISQTQAILPGGGSPPVHRRGGGGHPRRVALHRSRCTVSPARIRRTHAGVRQGLRPQGATALAEEDAMTARDQDGEAGRAIRLTRRDLLKGTVVAGGAAFLAACSSTPASQSAAPQSQAPATVAPTAAATTAPTAAATTAPTAAATTRSDRCGDDRLQRLLQRAALPFSRAPPRPRRASRA